MSTPRVTNDTIAVLVTLPISALMAQPCVCVSLYVLKFATYTAPLF